MANPDSEVLRATQSFRAGRGLFVHKGDLFAADSDVVKGREQLFTSAVGGVRTTAAVNGPVVSPPPFLEGHDGDQGEGDPGAVERPNGNGSADDWRAYVASLGYTADDLADMKRPDLIALADRLEGAGD